MKLRLTIIICTKDRHVDLLRCIESILNQTFPASEITIIDSSKTAESRSILTSLLSTKTLLNYIHVNAGLTTARNIGIAKSHGNILVFLDDDVILDKDYLKEIYTIFTENPNLKIGGITGNIIQDSKETFSRKHLLENWASYFISKIFFLFTYSNGNFQPSGFPTFVYNLKVCVGIQCLSGSNMAFRREVIEEFKFDEHLSGYSFMEDDDISYRVSQRYQNIYSPNAKLTHVVSPSARDRCKARNRMLIMNHRYLFKKNIPQTFKHKTAFCFSIMGLFLMEIIKGNAEGSSGLWEGLTNILPWSSH